MSKDRRYFSRVEFARRVFLIKGDVRLETKLIDISMRGALIEHSEEFPLQTGELCTFEFHLNEATLILAIEAKLVFSKDDHMGFQFVEMDLGTLTHLRRLIELNVGDPELVQEELFFLVNK